MKHAGQLSDAVRYALGGVLLGLLISILATQAAVQQTGQGENWATLIQIQRALPWLWILDTGFGFSTGYDIIFMQVR